MKLYWQLKALTDFYTHQNLMQCKLWLKQYNDFLLRGGR